MEKLTKGSESTTSKTVHTHSEGVKELSENVDDSLAKDMSQIQLLRIGETLTCCKCGRNQYLHHTPSPTSPHSSSSPLLVKVRVSGSGESDFVEVEVAPPTYPALVSACCEELELTPSDVAKIRKLPNVLVRKDRDVQRMADGQELEVVLGNNTTTAPPYKSDTI